MKKAKGKGVYIPFKLGGGGRVKQVYLKGKTKYIKEGKHFIKISRYKK